MFGFIDQTTTAPTHTQDVYIGDFTGNYTGTYLDVNVGVQEINFNQAISEFTPSSPGNPAVRIFDGTQAAGYVFTSDASGNGSWKPGAAGTLPAYANNAAAVTALGAGKFFVTDGTDITLAKGLVMQTY